MDIHVNLVHADHFNINRRNSYQFKSLSKNKSATVLKNEKLMIYLLAQSWQPYKQTPSKTDELKSIRYYSPSG